MTKLIHSEKIEKKLNQLNIYDADDKADAYVVDGFKMYEVAEEGFNIALKAKEKNMNVYYAYYNDFILFFMAAKESDVVDRVLSWKEN